MSMTPEFDLTNICANVAAKTPGYAESDIRDILKIFFGETAKAVAEYGRVEYKGFGTIKLRLLSERHGVDPQGEPYRTPERIKAVFKSGPAFKQVIATQTGKPVL